jgi:hypothetical protein
MTVPLWVLIPVVMIGAAVGIFAAAMCAAAARANDHAGRGK